MQKLKSGEMNIGNNLRMLRKRSESHLGYADRTAGY